MLVFKMSVGLLNLMNSIAKSVFFFGHEYTAHKRCQNDLILDNFMLLKVRNRKCECEVRIGKFL